MIFNFFIMKESINKAKTKQQIAEEYGICIRTLNKWLLERNIIIKRGLISPKEQEIINTKLGTTIIDKNFK
jgi:hypothetical protein